MSDRNIKFIVEIHFLAFVSPVLQQAQTVIPQMWNRPKVQNKSGKENIYV